MTGKRRQFTSWFFDKLISRSHSHGCGCAGCSVDRVIVRWGDAMPAPVDMKEWHRRRYLARAMHLSFISWLMWWILEMWDDHADKEWDR
jgi:hypothetical protein